MKVQLKPLSRLFRSDVNFHTTLYAWVSGSKTFDLFGPSRSLLQNLSLGMPLLKVISTRSPPLQRPPHQVLLPFVRKVEHSTVNLVPGTTPNVCLHVFLLGYHLGYPGELTLK